MKTDFLKLPRSGIVIILVLTQFLIRCRASTIPIIDSIEAFPYLRSVDNPSRALQWHSGTMIQLLGSCKLIRITRRGIRCIAANDQLLSGWEKQFSSDSKLPTKAASDIGVYHSLDSAACVSQPNALCVTSKGRRFFPTDMVYVSELSVGKCLNGQGRLIAPEGAYASDAPDDVSLCDVLDTNLDIVYDPVKNRIFEIQLGDSVWLYTILSFLVLVVVVLTAETVSQRSRSNITHNVVAWILLAGTSLLMLTHVDGRMHPFVTVQDVQYTVIAVVYITFSTIYWLRTISVSHQINSLSNSLSNSLATEATVPNERLGSEDIGNQLGTQGPSETQRDGINAMIGTIHFATCVIYGTVDNAYVTGFFFVFLFRTLQKLHDAHKHETQWTTTSNTVLLLDMTYTSLLFFFGVLPHYADEADAVLYAVALYVVCEAIAANYDSDKSPT